MSTLVESLKRLYNFGKIKVEYLQTMVQNGKITQEEFEYITVDPMT